MTNLKIINLIKYIMNNPNITVYDLSKKFNKSSQQIRKDILQANELFDDKNYIYVNNSNIISNIEYNDFINFTRNIDFNNYVTTVDERINLLIVLGYFGDVVNLTYIYDFLNISLTTKKKDSNSLKNILNIHDLNLIRIPGKGIKISGFRLQYRILVAKILSYCCDLVDKNIVERQANSPIEKLVFNTFMNNCKQYQDEVDSLVNKFTINNKISYYSSKFIYIYFYITLHDGNSKFHFPTKMFKLDPLVSNVKFNNLYEDTSINYINSMIEFVPSVSMPHNIEFRKIIIKFYNKIKENLSFNMITKNSLIDELYDFIYRQYFINHFQYIYDDKLVKNTDKQYPELLQVIKNNIIIIEKYLETKFNMEQISSIILIFNKWITKNTLLDTDRKKIILVTNISFERVNYFVENLHTLINFEYITTLNISQLNELENYNYDLIISFSNRITNILEKLNHNCVQVQFFITNDDLIKLFENGCKISSNRLLASDIVNKIIDLDEDEAKKYLKDNYGNIFL